NNSPVIDGTLSYSIGRVLKVLDGGFGNGSTEGGFSNSVIPHLRLDQVISTGGTVPEPASMLTWLVCGGIAVVATRRRNTSPTRKRGKWRRPRVCTDLPRSRVGLVCAL